MNIERFFSIAFGALGAVLCMGVVLFFDAEVVKRHLGEQRTEVIDKLSTTRAKIEAALNSRLSLVEGMAAFVKSAEDIRNNQLEVFSERFQTFSSKILKDIKGIRSLQLAPDGVVTYINPLKGNEAALGHDLRADPARRDAAEQAIRERKLIVAGPVELRQGGIALIGRLPIFLPSERGQKERFWGFSIILIDLKPLLEAGGLLEKYTGLRYAIRGKDGLGAEGAVFYGEEALFNANPMVLEVYLPNGFWQIAAIPAEGWGGETPDRINLWIFGIVLAGVFGFLIFVLLNRPIQLRSALNALRENEEKLKETNQQLTEMAVMDGLTGVGNRRAFDDHLQSEWGRCQRSGDPVSLIIFDIDFFKIYNDTYGHLAGDTCLKRIADVLLTSSYMRRPGDLLARYGGEEFVVVLSGSGEEAASKIGERIRSDVATMKIPHEKTKAEGLDTVTVSIGVAGMVPQRGETPKSLIKAADEALYSAKFKGRNCVVVSSEIPTDVLGLESEG